MIHPNTTLKYINESVGYGVFATQLIPKGTIVYIKDSLEIMVSPMDYLLFSPEMQEVIEKYSYIDERGNRIVSWDFAKYVNHCCDCNTISTGYGFELAIRDIQPGEQITDEYGIFNLEKEMYLQCGKESCRKVIRPSDFDEFYQDWDVKIRGALPKLYQVEQPLLPLLDEATRQELDQYFIAPERYKSVYSLKYQTVNPSKRVL